MELQQSKNINGQNSIADAMSPIVCLSHLRWDFVFQRPQHLMTRLARTREVLYVEEPVATTSAARLELRVVAPNVTVAVPHLPASECAPGQADGDRRQIALLAPVIETMEARAQARSIVWYYTPMALPIGISIDAATVVYDCMDELSNFRFAPASLLEREKALLQRADLVFAGGHSLYEAKRGLHRDAHEFPSSVDKSHFARALQSLKQPADLAQLGHPRIGYCGVIDERLDLDLLAAAAAVRPDWQWVMLGPVVKVDPASLPQAANIHYLGAKLYAELPAYLGHWDAAMMPFALNDATRFISPTKTPEYLAAGLAVASTPVVDVVASWGRSGLVHIGQGVDAFVDAVGLALADEARSQEFLGRVEQALHGLSWDRTAAEMARLIDNPRALSSKPSVARGTAQEVAWTA